jgi:hypothetical protein
MSTKKEIEIIKERNKRVESDKAWETSWTRRGLVAIITYATVVSFFIVAGLPNAFINAVIPTIGFLLSTLGLGIFKKFWLKKVYKN